MSVRTCGLALGIALGVCLLARHGQRVRVDDGTCPPGLIKQVVGGNVGTGQGRTRSCVPHP